MGTRLRKVAVVLIALVGTTSCVSRGRYDALTLERDRANEKLAALQRSNLELSGKLSASETRVTKLRGTYDQLVAELEGEVTAGQVEIQKLVDGIRLNVSDSLLFPSGSARLESAGREVLGRVAEQIERERAIVSVIGHTDNVMISEALRVRYPSNWELAAARAASVAKQLSARGVDPKRLRVVSRGPFDPIASNGTRKGRSRNRRTEIILRPPPSSE